LAIGSAFVNRGSKQAQPVPEYLADNSTILKLDRLSTISVWDELLARFDFIEGLKKQMAEADLNLTVGRLTAMILLCGAVGLALTQNVRWIPGWAAFGFSCVCGFAPYGWVLRRRSQRFAKLQEQLPDALDSLSRALRAGHPLIAGIAMLASEAPVPLAGEMRRVYEERRLGLSWEQALGNLSARVPLLEMSTFIAAVQLQNRTGGKLSEVLARLSENMREAEALRGEVKAIAAHGRMTGHILTVLPVLITVMLILVSPGYLDILIRHPNGKNLIWAAACALVAAHFVIRKMVDIRL
jgi:tight adherence protein B